LKKKISLEEWTHIGRLNHAAKWCQPLCTYTLIKEDERTFKREQKVNWLAYILIFIPIHILQALVCMWDGGLKEFIIFSRNLGCDTMQRGSESFKRAEEIWASED
jgi:hypothetical protein